MINETTSHLGLQLPHPSNTLEDDVLRLRSAINGIDTKFQALDALLSSDDINLDTLQELVSAIKGDAANLLSHVGSGGTAHAVATQLLAGFMSATDKTSLDNHLGSGGTAHETATGTTAGFMSAADKAKLDGASLGVLLDTVEISPASDGATSLTVPGGYTVGCILVFQNGSKLRSADFTATDGVNITLTSPATMADEFDVVRFKRALAA